MKVRIELKKDHFALEPDGKLSISQYTRSKDCPVYRAFKEQHPGKIVEVGGYGEVLTEDKVIKVNEKYDYYTAFDMAKAFFDGREEPFVLTYEFPE